MHWKRDDSGIFVKLDAGDNLFDSIRRIAEKELPNGGMIVMAIGMLRDFTIGYYDGKEYHKKTLEKGHELLGLHGSIRRSGRNGDDIDLHIHCIVADEEHMVMGGHLFSAIVDPLVEMLIIPSNKVLVTKKYREETGLEEMMLE